MEQGSFNAGKGVLCGPIEGNASFLQQRSIEDVSPPIVFDQAQGNMIPCSQQASQQQAMLSINQLQHVGSVVHSLPQKPQPYDFDDVEVGSLDLNLVRKLAKYRTQTTSAISDGRMVLNFQTTSVIPDGRQVQSCDIAVIQNGGQCHSFCKSVPIAESGRGRGNGRGRSFGRQQQILDSYMSRQDDVEQDDEQFQDAQVPDIQQVVQQSVVDTLSGLIDDLALSSDTTSGDVDVGVEPTFGVLNQPVFPQVGMQQSVQQQGVPVGEGMGAVGAGPSLQPREIKLQKPSTFSGKHSELNNFIFEMKQYIDTVGLGSDSRACKFLVTYLKGDAMTWWRTYATARNSNLGSVFDHLDLDTLVTELESQFTDIDEKMHIRNKLFNLRQTDKVQYYTTNFRRLQVELANEQLDDHTAMHIYIQGLKPAVRQQVLLQRPNTFEDCVLCAERADQASTLFGGNNYRQYNQRGFGRNRSNFRGNSRFNGNGQYRGNNQYRGNGNFGGSRGGISQFSDHPYKGNAPMALGNVQKQQQQSRFSGQCSYCGKSGHMQKDCWKKQREQGGQQALNVAKQVAAILGGNQQQQQQNVTNVGKGGSTQQQSKN